MKQFFLVAILLTKQIFTDAQNIGIGTSNPTRAKLEVHGAVDATSAIFGGDGTGISLQRNWPGIGFNHYYNAGHRYIANGFAARQFVDPTAGYMAFDMFTNGTANATNNIPVRALTLYAGGMVQAGPNYFNANLTVSRGQHQQATAWFFGNKHHSTFNYDFAENTYIRAGKDNGTVFINDIPASKIAMSGFVGINTASPLATLEIRQQNGTGLSLVNTVAFENWEILVGDAGTLVFSYDDYPKGYFRKSDGAYILYSDARLKRGIRPLPSILQKIGSLTPVEYEMMDGNPKRQKSIGFLAQEVEKVFPELVNVATDTVRGYEDKQGLRSLNYTDFGVLAIKAIQEQQEVLQAQGEKTNAQQKSIDALLNELKALKSFIKESIATKN